MRDYNKEARDLADRKYAYEFDSVLRDYMMQTFRPLLPPGRALEMGCYHGDFTAMLGRVYTDLTVIEAAADLIAVAKKKVRADVRFIHQSFEKVKLRETFDAIFLMHTLEHLDKPVPVLSRLNKWLTKDGLLFLVVPNANAPSRQIAVKMRLISHNAAVAEGEARHGHRCTYTFDTLERDARDAGLRVVHRGGVFFKPLANYQFDQLMKTDIIGKAYLDGCYALGMQYPDLCASIYLVCGKGEAK